jgi:hypothetical protein
MHCGLGGKVFTAAKADLEPRGARSWPEESARVQHVAHGRQRDAYGWQCRFEERRLSGAKLLAFATTVKPPPRCTWRIVRALKRR